ncbi:MAG: hypothetical protein ACFFBP_20365 [Promethearchaeota archaeon]
MHELIYYSLVILVFIRLVGLIVSVDFYYDSRSKTYIYSALGWGLWIITGIFPLISNFTANQTQIEFFLLMNLILGPLALTFLITSLSSYYINISHIKILIFSLILTIFPLIIYFTLGFDFVSAYTRIYQFIIIFLLFLLPILRFSNFKEKIGKSIRWYYLMCLSIFLFVPLVILTILNNANFNLFQSEDIFFIILIYTSIIIMTILVITFMIHLEYNISYEHKKDLKDKYSHDLGNILQAIESSHFITSSNNNIDKENLLEAENIIKKKFREASETLKEIRKL